MAIARHRSYWYVECVIYRYHFPSSYHIVGRVAGVCSVDDCPLQSPCDCEGNIPQAQTRNCQRQEVAIPLFWRLRAEYTLKCAYPARVLDAIQSLSFLRNRVWGPRFTGFPFV